MKTRNGVAICNLLIVVLSAGLMLAQTVPRSYSWQAQVHRENVFSGTSQPREEPTQPTKPSTSTQPTQPTEGPTSTTRPSTSITTSITESTTTSTTTSITANITTSTTTTASTIPRDPGSPETGDPGNMSLWFVLMIASAIGLRWVISQTGPKKRRI